MKRTGIAAVLFALSNCCHAQIPQPLRYLTPAAYPEPESTAVWRSLGASYVRKAVQENLVDRDPDLNARIDAIITAVGRAAGGLFPRHAGSAWRSLLIDDFGHGAVAFPGGTVLVDATFVRQLQMTDDELALLLAHEVAHVVAGHPSEKLSFVADRLGKDKAPTAGSALREFFSADAYAELFRPTARLQEREADAIGAAVLYASGYDAGRALEVFDKLSRLESAADGTEHSTHDTAAVRRQAFSKVLEGLRRAKRPPST